MKKIFDLRCIGEAFPLNVTDRLYFTWKLAPCQKQESATLRLFDKKGECIYLRCFESSKQFLEAEDHPEFVPLETYTYTIEVKTDAFTEESDPCGFMCGLTEGFLPTAKWISSGARFVAESETVGSAALYFKKNFLAKVTENAVLHVCAAGFYEAFINGKKVSDRVLEPAFTQYDKRVLYSSYDVSSMLKKGENSLEIVLGDGWYNQTTKDTWGFYRAPWRDVPKFILQLNMKDTAVVSDREWDFGAGNILSNAVRAGEMIDARKKTVYTSKACVVAPPGGIIYPQQMPPVREVKIYLPVSEKKTASGRLYDFGQNMAGYCSAVLKGVAGSEVQFIYSDREQDGICDNTSNSMYIFNPGLCYQTDTIYLDKNYFEYCPKFVYHGFRYVQVKGDAEIKEIRAHFVHTDFRQIGQFICSEPLLNNLYAMSLNAICSNYHGFPTDCPHREKNGWTGDAQLSLETSIMNFDMHESYRKWLNDFKDNMRISGQISAIVPSCGWGYNWGSGPAWDVAMFRITKALYYYYSDRGTAREMLSYLKRYAKYMESYENRDGLYSYGLGDWNYPKNLTFDVCPTELTDSCYCLEIYDTLYDFCNVFEEQNSNYYAEKAKALRRNIVRKYSSEKSLTGMCALTYFQLTDRTEDILKYLKEHDHRLHCGIIGAKFLFEVLEQKKLPEEAFKILTRKDYPSFGYWVACGQTTLCEDFELTNSLNHHMYSMITEYMMKAFGGIHLGEGMREIMIMPSLPKQLKDCKCSVRTQYGDIIVETSTDLKDNRKFKICIPPNTKAVFVYGGTEKRLYNGEYNFTF